MLPVNGIISYQFDLSKTMYWVYFLIILFNDFIQSIMHFELWANQSVMWFDFMSKPHNQIWKTTVGTSNFNLENSLILVYNLLSTTVAHIRQEQTPLWRNRSISKAYQNKHLAIHQKPSLVLTSVQNHCIDHQTSRHWQPMPNNTTQTSASMPWGHSILNVY